MHHSVKKWQYLVGGLLVLGLYFLVARSNIVHHYFNNPELLKEVILSFGILAPLAIIILQTFQTTISIIPSQLTTIVAGFAFGPILGLVYSLIGAALGSAITFSFSRRYGKKLSEKLFEKKELAHFHRFFKQKKLWALFLARMAPIFPNDVVSFAAGLTKIKFRNFNVVSTIGFVTQMIVLSMFGSRLAEGEFSFATIFFSVLVGILFLVVVFKKKIKKVLIKDIHKIEARFLF